MFMATFKRVCLRNNSGAQNERILESQSGSLPGKDLTFIQSQNIFQRVKLYALERFKISLIYQFYDNV